jgi:predicted TIM-barrel fold metal-dependent hydrolase
VIVDFHTHVFPPAILARRERYLAADATFGELYGDPKAKLATADDLLASMREASIDVSVAMGFAWSDTVTGRQHNEYLLEAAADSRGRLVAFCTLPLAATFDEIEAEARRCVAGGARGFGELRPENLGFDVTSDSGDRLAELSMELGSVLLFHVSEPAGHAYPGKEGLALDKFYRFVADHPGVRAVGAHWAGGLPLYSLMPEVKQVLAAIHVDTAATSLLYDASIYTRVAKAIGPDRILFGSDYPLLAQERSRRRVEEAGLDKESQALILGRNAGTLLGLQ